jgi:hypothetical protein
MSGACHVLWLDAREPIVGEMTAALTRTHSPFCRPRSDIVAERLSPRFASTTKSLRGWQKQDTPPAGIGDVIRAQPVRFSVEARSMRWSVTTPPHLRGSPRSDAEDRLNDLVRYAAGERGCQRDWRQHVTSHDQPQGLSSRRSILPTGNFATVCLQHLTASR